MMRSSLMLLFTRAIVILSFVLLPSYLVESKCILFNFGDSHSDTGGLIAGLGLYLGPPAGRQFFHRTTGRFSDGRLYIDFLCENLKIKYLSPYLESSGSDYRHGVNFAVAGSGTEANVIPFSLSVQVQQFLHFKNRTRELRPEGLGSLITEKEFRNAVHSFDTGQNDISVAFSANLSFSEVVKKIPAVISRIKDSIQMVYDNGGRKIMIYNTGPLGCLPQTLALRKTDNSKLDENGCLQDYNNAAKALNSEISNLCDEMKSNSSLNGATIVCVDMYSIKYDLVANHTHYGFATPLMACCGHGGPPYNYANRMTCGQPTATPCPEGARFISWDGVHYTETANEIIASKILSAKYSKPTIKLKTFCSKFS